MTALQDRSDTGRRDKRVRVFAFTPEWLDRFWHKVDKSGPVSDYAPELGPCWLWTKGRFSTGYGQQDINGLPTGAHRIAYELERGPIPDGLQLDHLCRVRHCVRPAHLEPVSRRTNILRGFGMAAVHARQTHCQKGHLYDADNTHIRRNGGRECRICRAAYQKALYESWRKENFLAARNEKAAVCAAANTHA